MSENLKSHLHKLSESPQTDTPDEPENYETRPVDVVTTGYPPAPPDPKKAAITPPLTETSRVTTPVTITSGNFSVTVDVATKITMTDANGVVVIFNYAAP